MGCKGIEGDGGGFQGGKGGVGAWRPRSHLLPVERGVAALRLEGGEARLTLGGGQRRQAVDAHEQRVVE